MSRLSKELLFTIGLICMLIALFEQNITLASQRYGPTLLKALAFTAAADICFGLLIWKGGRVWRLAAGVMTLPTLLVVADFLRRAPGAF